MTITLTKPNSAPVISSLTANPTAVYTGETSNITCSANDPDGQTLYYSWNVTGGTVSGSVSGPSITWTAPATTGSYTISCTVSDGQDTDKESKTITVSETPVDPVITVSSPNGGESWTRGTSYNITWTDNIDANVKIELFKGITLANTIIASTESDGTYSWAIPTTLTAGTDYKVKITSTTSSSVLDESNAVFTIIEEQTGNNPPVINSLTADSLTIYPNNSTLITCNATDPDGDNLTYTWDNTAGTISGLGSSITWTAPSTTGIDTITCSVSDGTDKVSQSVNVIVREPSEPGLMVLIPAGTYMRGNHFDEGYEQELPVHQVTLNSFYIGKYEVTQKEWKAIIGSNPSEGQGVGDNYPVYFVGWYETIKYCNLKSMAEGFTPCYEISNSTNPADWGDLPDIPNSTWDAVVCDFTSNGYRLPTDAEWEYAARGGLEGQRFPNGATISHSTNGDTQANYQSKWEDGFPVFSYDVSPTEGYHPDYYWSRSPVGSFNSNGYGLYDMAGNSHEWCWDWWHFYTEDAVVNPTGPETLGTYRIQRSGSWYNTAGGCRVSYRFYDYPNGANSSAGFRLARTP